MIKKTFVLTWLSIITFQTYARDILVEGKAAAFLPTDSLFRKIYGNAGGIFGIEVTGQLYEELYGWASGSVFAKNGLSVGESDPTRVLFVPLDAGLKYLYRFTHVDLYVGIGATATYLQIKDHSPFVIPKQTKWGGGGIVKAGCNIGSHDSVFLDLFVDYSFIKVGSQCCANIQSSDANISGASLGVGVGYRF